MLGMLKDRIAVLPIEDPEKIGHIIIPDGAKRRPDQGVVKYRGADVKELRVGDHVLFSSYTGEKVSLDGEGVLIIMREQDVVALIGDGEEMFTREQIDELFARAHDREKEWWSRQKTVERPIGETACDRLEQRFMAELDGFAARKMEY